MAKVTVNKVLELARKQVGVKGTNIKKCKYNTAFYGAEVSGSAYDWCAVFIWWLFKQLGAADMLYVKTAGCGVLGNAFYTRGKFKTSGFRAGDIVFFHWSKDKSESVPITYSLDHVGIIEKVNADGSYTTIEGNTGGTANGEVKRQTRYASQISGVARPDYAASTSKAEKVVDTVKSVQNWLNTNFKTGLTADNIYGAKTKAALVKALQMLLNRNYKAGLTVDGIYGAKTNAAVRSLKSGAKGNYTKVLQGLLICNGFNTGGLDGIFGKSTEKAVKSYQKKKGLTVDGIAGPNTFAKLCK